MANKGKLGEQQFISEATWDAMHANPVYGPMLPEAMGTYFTDSGLSYFDYDKIKAEPLNSFFGRHPQIRQSEFEGHSKRKGYYGWYGAGGSVFQWNPENQIGFGYVPSDHIGMDVANFRGSTLQEVASQCAAAVGKE